MHLLEPVELDEAQKRKCIASIRKMNRDELEIMFVDAFQENMNQCMHIAMLKIQLNLMEDIHKIDRKYLRVMGCVLFVSTFITLTPWIAQCMAKLFS